MQGIGTLAVTILAIYGVFFTDLPTILIRQLQTEVADTKEDVVLLKREKQSLLDQITASTTLAADAQRDREIAEAAIAATTVELSGLRASLTQAEQDLKDLAAEKQALTIERDLVAAALATLRDESETVRRQVAKLTSERDVYLDDAFGDAIASLVTVLGGRISGLQGQIKTGEYFQDLPRYAMRERELDRRLMGNHPPAEVRRIIEEWSEQYAGDREFLMFRLLENRRGVDVIILEQRNKLAKLGAAPRQTGASIVSSALVRKDFDYLLERDWNALNKAIAALVKEDEEAMSLSLTLALKPNFSNQELASEIVRVSNALSKFHAFIERLPEGLADRLKRKKS